MENIRDDPIISRIEATGYPPWWHQPDYPDFADDPDYPEDYEEDEYG